MWRPHRQQGVSLLLPDLVLLTAPQVRCTCWCSSACRWCRHRAAVQARVKASGLPAPAEARAPRCG
jgi:hypothetical protein